MGTVWLGSTYGTVVSWSDTQVVATVASNSTSGTAQVQQGGAWSNAVVFNVSTPTILSVTPASGLPYTPVTITGSGFGAAQNSGQVWLGTAYGTVQSWSDTQVVALVASGSTTGNAQVLQNGVWSNALPFSVNTLQIASVSPASGSPGTPVTITGISFGPIQGSGSVLLGSTSGQVLTWSDTQIVAAVAPTSVSGVARVQQNSVWSNAVSFTVTSPGGSNEMTLAPNVLNMVVGDTHTIQALNAAEQSVTGLTWKSSDPTVVSLSTDDPPLLTALAAGHVTITAGAASADVTVSAVALPLGTVLWSNPGDGTDVDWIVPAVPSPSGVADVFALRYENGTVQVQAIKSDGTTAWTANVGWAPGPALVPDFQGGVVACTGGAEWETPGSIVKYDGITGLPYPAYTPDGGSELDCWLAVHPDGTIFTILVDQDGNESVIGIDPNTGTQKFSVPLPSEPLTDASDETRGLIVAGDGYAYVACGVWQLSADETQWISHLSLVRVNTAGAYDNIKVLDWTTPIILSTPFMPLYQLGMITNADQGILLTWAYCEENPELVCNGVEEPVEHGMAITTGASASLVSAPQVPADEEAWGLIPVLQAQDGSFVGTAAATEGYGPYTMVAFDASGNVRWSVPNDQPLIATDDGGVIGQSGITYDQNGNATRQMSLFTQSWLGYAYRDGPVAQVLGTPFYIAASFWPFLSANASGNSASVHLDWYPDLAHCTTTPGCIGPYEAVHDALSDLVARLRDPTVGGLAQTAVFNSLGNDANGNRLTTASFIGYLTKNTPGLYDGLRSNYCYAALTPGNGLCNYPPLNWISTKVGDFLANNPTAGAVTGTPSNPLLTYFRPSIILYPSLGDNLGNEGMIFHEALHGLTGMLDEQLLRELGVNPFAASCNIAIYIQKNVLSHSQGLDPTATSCPCDPMQGACP
jgi:hypothetical protein